ncbi:hypothetical protein HNQ02_000619 [Flavobacterium sp. 7E]|uniref:transglutaminase domain-containing protein n=1 Tax=Flavobacterium sp. 7E TaxID=2735898 RepID=UPI0015700F46|nr:transglutaminase domain-containing protein [Flavobacterium sp. 7E]NRS87712.1 hypothetical protein [Flavobacterium sp. 7E]
MPHCLKILVILTFYYQGTVAQHPHNVEQNLIKSGANQIELEKAISHCLKTNDPLKLEAIYFLIANMDIHYSSDYYWEDEMGKKINYNELDYPNFEQANKAFEILKTEHKNIQPKKIVRKDLESVKGDYLINNLEKAFANWKYSSIKETSFNVFCEYILPYRVSIEPLQEWRTSYNTKFSWVSDKAKDIGLASTLPYITDEANSWFMNTWRIGGREEPLPLLGSMQILMRKQGACEDLGDLGVFTMRSQGFPATVDFVPYWATSKGSHVMNTFFDENNEPMHFDYGTKDYNEELRREPAKVLRLTYSKQETTLAEIEEESNIPIGYLRQKNYIDVTAEYWKTTDVKCSLYPIEKATNIVYACTFNGLHWKPFWWGKIKNNETQFSKISQGTIVLPQYYNNEKFTPAGPPILVTTNETKILTPEIENLQNLTIFSVANYLIIKPSVIYKLYYWNDGWKITEKITATETSESLLFHNVPKNALLLLVASDTKGFERPFIVDNNGDRHWY